MRRQRVYFFNRFFWPDSSATAQILTDLCRGLDKHKHQVTVVTSRLNYADPSIRLPARESVDGITVIRLWSTRFGRATLPGRLMDYLTIYLSFFLFMLRELGADDIAVYKTDPPLLSIPGAVGRMIKGYEMIGWCQDIFPEVAISEIQVPGGTRWVFSLIAKARNWSLQCAAGIVVLGDDMARFLQGQGIAPDKLRRISNWSVQDEKASGDGTELRKEWEIPEDTFVFGYSGNLGRAHDWQTVLHAAEILKDEADLLFLCCGGGHGFEMLRKAVEERQPGSRFRFLPYQPLENLAASLKVPDVHWLSLKASLSPYIFPSKFYGILQAGRPLIFIGSKTGELAGLIEKNGIGKAVAEGESGLLAQAILDMKGDRAALGTSGKRARELWQTCYQKQVEIQKWECLLLKTGPKSGGTP
jgi:glycosyltransferase involved in cell wall biosynthesis